MAPMCHLVFGGLVMRVFTRGSNDTAGFGQARQDHYLDPSENTRGILEIWFLLTFDFNIRYIPMSTRSTLFYENILLQ